ncbi:putative DNA binding domain-containing protein [Sulfitobacter sp. W027]|uniref:ATP-binding protein n=1 Tax=Sulfitobacter sp. W027 TaxID=2867025 RepID=UPI0021A4955F|nr:ATP-binding protein [Sulfitobacter sp. W027]UWR33719.1 putative DNA binding domain-containing protein [Sulfitobacter sp. W027]
MQEERDIALIDDLRGLSAESPWLEFKVNQADPQKIGVLISALSNAARLEGKETAFLVWGVEDKSHAVVSTTFDPGLKKVGNQVFEFWLRQKLSPSPAFTFRTVDHPDGKLVLLEIPAPTMAPVSFEGVQYIRVGSATPRLSEDPERYTALIEKMRPYTWESGVALNFVLPEDIMKLLDANSYFTLTKQQMPDSPTQILEKMEADRLIHKDVGGRWNVLNLGAILFANDLRDFNSSLERKAVRFVRYDGASRASIVTHRQDGRKGYATGFEGLMAFINALLPTNEHIGQALRETRPLFPELSLRELVANALIHQDMTISGTGPQVELFEDRIEITNPGSPLVPPDRMVDLPPRSRNESLASLMRRMGMCEEQGSGLDKVFTEVEFYQLPAPLLKDNNNSMQVVMYGPRTFAEMSRDERVRACYWHTVLKFMAGDRMKNNSLCGRLGVDPKNASMVSGVISKALEAGLIKVADEAHPKAGYYPVWA